MKEVRFVVMCCVVFAVSVLSGLAMHSCRTVHKTAEKTADFKGTLTERSDSAFLASIFQKWAKNIDLTINEYTPVIDSAGRVTDNVLTREVKFQSAENAEAQEVHNATVQHSKNDSINFKSEVLEEVDKAPPKRVFMCVFLVIIVSILFYVVKKRMIGCP